MKLREPRIGGRHYRLHPLDTTEGVNSAHALTLSIIEGRRITRISREKIKASFTFNNIAAYTAPVAAKSAARVWRPGIKREHAASRPNDAAFFVLKAWLTLFGRAVREAFGPAGSLDRFANPHGSALPVWRQVDGNLKPSRGFCHA